MAETANNPHITNILVTKLGHIGDVLVVTPFFKVLKDLFPAARITALVNQGTEEMALNCPWVDEVLLVNRNRQGALGSNWRLIRALRKKKFDISFELSNGDRGIYMCRLAGARHRIGFKSDNKLGGWLLHQTVERYGPGEHEVNNFLRQIKALGHQFAAPPLQWRPPAEMAGRADEILQRHGLELKKFVLVHPTSRWMFKTWTAAKNARVINWLAAKGWPVVLTSGPDDKEMAFINEVLRQVGCSGNVTNLAGQLNLSLLGALIKRAALFFGVDSAPMHLAAALQTPTVALFGPSGEFMWGPWQVPHHVVSGDCLIRPCGQDGCNGSKVCNSLRDLPVEKVERAIDDMLERGSCA